MQVDVIFCDDIRPEVSGKQTLVGVYPNGMMYGGLFPGSIRVATWVRVSGLTAGPHKLHFVVRPPGSVLDDMGMTTDVMVNAPWLPVVFFRVPFNLNIPHAGNVNALLSIDEAPMLNVGSLNVITAEPQAV